MKNPLGIKLDGCVYSLNEENLTEEEFSNAFIAFIEEKGWCFGGELTQIDEEGNHVINIE